MECALGSNTCQLGDERVWYQGGGLHNLCHVKRALWQGNKVMVSGRPLHIKHIPALFAVVAAVSMSVCVCCARIRSWWVLVLGLSRICGGSEPTKSCEANGEWRSRILNICFTVMSWISFRVMKKRGS